MCLYICNISHLSAQLANMFIISAVSQKISRLKGSIYPFEGAWPMNALVHPNRSTCNSPMACLRNEPQNNFFWTLPIYTPLKIHMEP